MRRLLLLASVALLIGGTANAQIFGAAPLSPRALPPGVSIPTIASTDLVYPGCPVPPTTFGNIWHFDPSTGQTMAAYTTAGISLNPLVTPHQGDATHPWNSFQAVLTLQSGYTTPLLATVTGSTGPIKAGDEALLNTGNYGKIISSGTTINSPALTVAAASGQTPVFSNLIVNRVTGFVFNGIKLQSLNDDSNPLFGSGDGGGTAMSNIVLNHMDISSTPVATADGWTQAQWLANARSGVLLEASDVNTALSCVSVVNSHVYVTQQHNGGAITVEAANSLVQNNEIDHFSTDAIDFASSNIALINNYKHDSVLVNPGAGDQYYATRNQGGVSSSVLQTNVTISRDKSIESIDPSQTFNAVLNGYLNSNGDITNFSYLDNLFAGNGTTGAGFGNTHNGIVCNNSFMGNGQVQVETAHGGSTGPEGNPPSNVRICNNIAPLVNYYGNNVQADHNIATQTTGFPVSYVKDWSLIFVPATTGSVTTVSSDSGVSNILDGIGQTNEFAAVPTANSFPMSPQPNWAPLLGSPAATVGGGALIPPITDYNGATFTSPYAIGGLLASTNTFFALILIDLPMSPPGPAFLP